MKKIPLISTLLLVIILLASGKAQAQKVDYKIASLFIYNFAQYIQWPANEASREEFVIGVVGNSPAAISEFKKAVVNRKTSKGQSVKVIALKSNYEALDCHIVFVPSGESSKIAELKGIIDQKPILLVSEKMGLAKKGSHINFFIDDDDDFKTKFELNKSAITQHGLRVSSELTAFAVVI
ncbi:protein of unknown function [Flexibacter flexilis DSM 6793]|uniref:DUF4154 domain-containing protein n=1 Tax=Flexibacter flexilis DSM 6793 TaxID=927664 RepID=A0A1I1FMA9_9BACT|nr:YfiR family protein [Flexibacter flexilis]SFC00659.1 protein of unknown function [Flexibacter flexilis DSM 6793]